MCDHDDCRHDGVVHVVGGDTICVKDWAVGQTVGGDDR